jgi:hypothetical protein
MATRHALHRGPRQHDLLHRLIQARTELAPEDYTLFFVTEEGRALPNSRPGDDVEEMSGYVLAHAGDIYFFWFGWDVGTQQPALTEWRPADPAPHWRHSAEYRRARERLQLSRT